LAFPVIGTLTKIRNPDGVTHVFVRRARKLGFPGVTLHNLRASHSTALLDQGLTIVRVPDSRDDAAEVPPMMNTAAADPGVYSLYVPLSSQRKRDAMRHDDDLPFKVIRTNSSMG
jgi:integrase